MILLAALLSLLHPWALAADPAEALLDASMETVNRLRDGALRKAGEADRLYVSLGFLVGLMLALVVI